MFRVVGTGSCSYRCTQSCSHLPFKYHPVVTTCTASVDTNNMCVHIICDILVTNSGYFPSRFVFVIVMKRVYLE
jgi:hypothetical protein